MEQTVQEQNKIIAEWMGAVYDGRKYWRYPNGKLIIHSNEYRSEMKYHSSWDWLMPAWYKFRDLAFTDRKNEIPHSHHCQSISRAICYEDIGSAYSRLSNAVEWYNEYLTHSQAGER